MKKLLITTMAVVSIGLCAKAADAGFISGTSFDDLQADANFVFDNDYWPNPTDTDDVFKITNVTYSAGAPNQHWDWTEDGEKALSIDTANPILRNVNPKDGETGENTAQDVSTDPVFFDSVVQFTATDVAPSMENNTTDKLAVWLYVSPDSLADGVFEETEAKTNLVITAGEWVDGSLKTKHYLTDKVIEPDSWHRLTIKSFVENDFDKFNVWVDGTPVVVEGVEAFDSLIDAEYTVNGTKLQGVAFDGKGAVDDIVFTTTAPEFAEAEKYAFTLNFSENVEIYSLEIGGEKQTSVSSGSSYDVEVGKLIYLNVLPKDGYTLTFEGGTFESDGFGGYEYSFTPSAAGSGTIKITAVSTGGGSGVTVGGTAVEFDNDGMIANITTAFDGKDVSGELDTTKFKSYYTAKVENGILSIKLDQKAAAPFAEATEDKEVLEVGEDASGNPVLTVRIKPYVGLYYGAMTGSALDNLTLTYEYQEATTTDVKEFTATGKAGDTAGFIKVVVTDIAPESTEE